MKMCRPNSPPALAGLLLGALAAGCMQQPVAPGQERASVLAAWGQPTARYALPGGERLEYASGPFGRTTWMIDLDANGRVLKAAQVLDPAHLAEVQARATGMSRDELLRTLGTPGERRHGGWMGGEVWSWRYPTHDCLWFQVSLDDAAKVLGAGHGIDPRCDAGTGDRM
jgi:hypothetical protein